MVNASGTGNAVVLNSGRNFINTAGANALATPNGRALVYSASPSANTLNGLTSSGKRYNTTYASYSPGSVTAGSGAFFFYTFNPTLTVTAGSGTKIYGDADPAIGYTTTGLLTGDTATGFATGTATTTASGVGSYANTVGIGSYANAENYTLSFVNGSLTVTPAALTVTADSKTKVYGDANPNFTVSYSGLKNGDTGAVFGGYTLDTTAITGSGIGSYAITLAGGSAGNYTITRMGGTLAIAQALLTVTAQNATRLVRAANPLFTAGITGFKNGDTTAVVSGLVVDSIADGTSPAGTYAITASNAIAANYSFAYLDGTLTVIALPVVPPITPSVSTNPLPTTVLGATSTQLPPVSQNNNTQYPNPDAASLFDEQTMLIDIDDENAIETSAGDVADTPHASQRCLYKIVGFGVRENKGC